MTDLKTLALAAQGWKVDTVIPATYEKPCEVGTMLDGEFYHLMTLDCEDYYGDSMPLAKYFVAASPDAILKLLEERDRLREAMKDTRKRLQEANESGVITDTLWYSQYETLFDYIDSALEEAR